MAFLTLDPAQLTMPAGEEERARAFYRDVLGMPEIPIPEPMRPSGGAWFRAGGVELHLGVEPDFRPVRKAHPALRVSDVDAAAWPTILEQMDERSARPPE
jgi:hypothetical protein